MLTWLVWYRRVPLGPFNQAKALVLFVGDFGRGVIRFPTILKAVGLGASTVTISDSSVGNCRCISYPSGCDVRGAATDKTHLVTRPRFCASKGSRSAI